jgi:phosphatidate cytidylyltransferase
MNTKIERKIGGNRVSKKLATPFRDLKYRLPIALSASFLSLILIYFSQIMAIQFLLVIVLFLIIFLGVLEWCALLEKKKIKPSRNLLIGFSALFIMSSYLQVLGHPVGSFNLFIVVVFSLCLALSCFRSVHQAIFSIGSNVLGIIFVVLPLSLILPILYPEGAEDGRLWLIYLLAVTKLTDVGGYFVGKIWGKRKLAPHLSPKKTIEGSIGGLAFSMTTSLLFCLFVKLLGGNFTMSWMGSISMGFILGVMAQIGDLTESLFKRDAQVKDSNNIPGIGGILDMFDSLTFAIPTLYLFMKIS